MIGSVASVRVVSYSAELAAPRRVEAAPKAAQDPLLDPAVQREIAQLAQRDREVRAHEQAHIAVGGELITSGPTYAYTKGPDRRLYATGGEVGIDTSPVADDPEATIDKAQRIRATALAPAEPSAQDRSVAAKASSMEQSARIDLAQRERERSYSATAAASNALVGRLIEVTA